MRTQISIAALTLGIALSLSAAAAEPNDEIAAAIEQWATAFSEHNVEKIVTLYAPDAVLWGTNAPRLRSDPAAIRAGNYTFAASRGGNAQTRPARYSFTYVKNGDKWLMVQHHSSPKPER